MEGMSNSTDCAGQPIPMGGGTYIGHVIPGLFILGWGLWWTVQHYLRVPRDAVSWYRCRWQRLAALEPVLKSTLPLLGIAVELWLDHHGQVLTLLCPSGTLKEGAIALRNIHNYQHAASYPPFMLSGLVDLLGFWRPHSLLPGTEHSFLALAFGLESMLMLLHKKHFAVDALVHWLLGMTMAANCAALLLDGFVRHPLVPILKSSTLIVQGAWLCCIGGLQYTARGIMWNEDEHALLMFVPVLFAIIILLTAASQLAFAAMLWHGKRPASLSKGSYGRLASSSKSESDSDVELALPEAHAA